MKVTEARCPTCGWEVAAASEFDARRLAKLHSQSHVRADRRRMQYRDSKRRARLVHKQQPSGWLHAMGCHERKHRRKPSCQPIPVYDQPVAKVRVRA